MGLLAHTLVRQLRQFWPATKGVAAVEFALAMPFMLLVYLGCVEAGQLIMIDRKVQTTASAVGDLVARTDGNLSAAGLRDYFQAASGIMHPYPPNPVLQTVSGVAVDAKGNARVLWSRQFYNSAYIAQPARSVGSEFKLPEEMANLALNQTVIVAEAQYRYRPFHGMVFDQAVELYHDSFHMPRTSKGVSLSP